LRGILGGVGWRRNRRRLTLLVELLGRCWQHRHRNRWSQHRTKPENAGQIHTHVKFDARNQPSGSPGILSSKL
jgi:hypothetical protein